MNNLKMFCFHGMSGGFTSGMLVAIAHSKDEAIDAILQQFDQDEDIRQKLDENADRNYEIIKQKLDESADDIYEGIDHPLYHTGTWNEHEQVTPHTRISRLIDLKTELEKDSNLISITPVKSGIAAYCGGAD